jgi:hypothetical protein
MGKVTGFSQMRTMSSMAAVYDPDALLSTNVSADQRFRNVSRAERAKAWKYSE